MTRGDRPNWLQPLWRRVVLVGFCAGWAALELYNGSSGWASIAIGMTLYGAWMYLYDWKDPNASKDPASKE